MTTTIESVMADLDTTTMTMTMTTTTMEEVFPTTTTTITTKSTIEELATLTTQQEETTTISSAYTTSEGSTGTPVNNQGDSNNIEVKKLINLNDIELIGKNSSTNKNIIQLSTTQSATNVPTTSENENYTTTMNVMDADMTTIVTPTEFSTPLVDVDSPTIKGNMKEIVSNELPTPEEKISTTVKTLESLKELDRTIMNTTMAPTIETMESWNELNKPLLNESTTPEEKILPTGKTVESLKDVINNTLPYHSITTEKPIPTTIENLKNFEEINNTPPHHSITTEKPIPTTIKNLKNLKGINKIFSNHSITTEKPIPTTQEINKTMDTTTTEERTTTIVYSRGRMLTTPAIFTETEANMYIPTENDVIMANNIENIFGTNMQPKSTNGTDVNVIIAIVVSIVGVIALLLLIGFLYLIRRRQKQTKQRCRPVGSDAYSLDNISVFGSLRRKSTSGRASKRTYSNAAFDDPTLCHNVLNVNELAKFVEHRSHIFSEFRNIPDITAKITEVPPGCEDKNRFANIVPLPETRVCLQKQNNDETTEYINANYVRGPNDDPKYYIATQAPLESTIEDFLRMLWEQNSRVIIQATDLVENGKDMCYEYLPQSVTLDNSNTFGDFQVILKNRDVRNLYAISTLILKNHEDKGSRELTHYWYKWPEHGVPTEEAPLIAMLLEVRASLKSYASEELNENRIKNETMQNSDGKGSPNGNKSNIITELGSKIQGPLTVHCSPGTGRTGTIIACDMAMRSLEAQKRSVDIPQLVYFIRRGRAGAVKTREQYELIYKVAKMYATKITTIPNDN